MNKVVTINLGGRAYQLEEQGFEALRAYLDEASSRLADDPGKSEIIADLEQAIGEKCDKVLNPHKTVVTSDDVKKIIDEMGPVEGEANNDGAAPGQAGAKVPHRFYLIRDGAVFGGVCTGLAAYFDIDVTLVRLLFILLTVLTGGIWILLYFALMLLVPYADTAEAKAQAHGEPFNAEALVQRAKERWGESYERVTGSKWDDLTAGLHSAHEEHLKWKETRKQQKQQWKREWRAQRYAWRRPNPALSLIRAALAIVWILAFVSLVSTGLIFGWTISGAPVWLMVILLFVTYFAVTGPMRTAQWAPYWSGDPYGNNYAWAYTPWDGFVDGMVVLFIIAAFAWAYTEVPQFYALVHHPIGDGIRPLVAWLKSL